MEDDAEHPEQGQRERDGGVHQQRDLLERVLHSVTGGDRVRGRGGVGKWNARKVAT